MMASSEIERSIFLDSSSHRLYCIALYMGTETILVETTHNGNKLKSHVLFRSCSCMVSYGEKQTSHNADGYHSNR